MFNLFLLEHHLESMVLKNLILKEQSSTSQSKELFLLRRKDFEDDASYWLLEK